MPIPFSDCIFTIDGQDFKGVQSFHDYMLKKKELAEKPAISPEQAEQDMTAAKAAGFDHPVQAMRSVEKRTGEKYDTFSDIPKETLDRVSDERKLDNNKGDRETNTVNKIFDNTVGIASETGFKSEEGKIYRATKQNQIDDIIESGYIRPKEGKMRGGKEGEVHWASGNDNLKYSADDKYILETDNSKFSENNKGALNIHSLSAVWKFNKENGKWEDVLPDIKEKYNKNKNKNIEKSSPLLSEKPVSKFKKVADTFYKLADTIEKPLSEGVQSDITGVPRAVIATAVRTAGKAIELSGKIADGVQAAVDYIKTQIQGIDEDRLQKEVNKLFRQNAPFSVAFKEKALEFQMGATAGYKQGVAEGKLGGEMSGMKKGRKEGVTEERQRQKEFADQVREYVSDAELKGKLTPGQAKSLINKAAQVGSNPVRFQKFTEFADKVIEDANYASDLTEVNSMKSKLGKPKFSDHIDTLKDLKRINPSQLSIESMREYGSILQDYLDSRKRPGTSQDYKPFDVKSAQEKLEKIQKELDEKLVSQMEDISGVLGLTPEEAQLMKDVFDADNADEFASNLSESKKKAVNDIVQKQLEYSQLGGKELLRAPELFQQHSDIVKEWIGNISKADLSGLPLKDKIDVIRTLDNAIVNESPSNLGRVNAMVDSYKSIPKLLQVSGSSKLFEIGKIRAATEDLPVLMKAIYGLSKAVSEIRRLTGWDKVFENGAVAKKLYIDKFKEYEKFRKENKISNKAEDRLRRGLFSTSIQHTGGDEFTINQQFENNKKLIEQSIEAYKQKKSTSKLAARLEKIYKEDIAPFSSPQELKDHFDTNNPGDVKMWKMFNETFEKLKPQLELISEGYQNKKFEGNIVDYTPRSYSFVERETLPEGNTTQMYFNNYVGKPGQTPTAISRTVKDKLPSGMAIDFDFDGNMLSKYKKAAYDIKTTAGRFLFSEFMKRKESGEIWGGLDNKEIIRKQYEKAERAGAGQIGESDIAGEILQSAAASVKNLGTTFALGGFTQYPKQYLSVGIRTALTLGKNMGLFFSVQKAPLKNIPLLDMYSISLRGEQMGGAVRTGKTDAELKDLESSFVRDAADAFKKVSSVGRNLSLRLLEEGDVRVAKRSWLAYYMQSLKEQGAPIRVSDLPTEHERINGDEKREKAAAYAQQMVDETQVVSNAALMSDLKRKDKNFYKEAIKNVLIPFNTFASNNRARMIEDIKFIFKGNGDQRKEAFGDLGASAAESVAFQGINTLILTALIKYPLHELLDWAFGLEDSDKKTFDERLDLEMKKFYSNTIKDVLVGGLGNTAETAFMKGVNEGLWQLHVLNTPDEDISQKNKRKWMQEQGLYVFDRVGIHPSDFLGTYGIYWDEVKGYYSDAKAAITGQGQYDYEYQNITEKEGYERTETVEASRQVDLNENEKSYMTFVSILNLLALGGFRDADLKRIADAKKREILRKQADEQKQSQRRGRRKSISF